MRKIIIVLSLLTLCACNPNHASSSNSLTTNMDNSSEVQSSNEFSSLSTIINESSSSTQNESSTLSNDSSKGGLVNDGEDKDSGFGELYG